MKAPSSRLKLPSGVIRKTARAVGLTRHEVLAISDWIAARYAEELRSPDAFTFLLQFRRF